MAIAKLSIDLEARLAKYETDMKRVVSLSENAAKRIESSFGGVAMLFTGLGSALSVGAVTAGVKTIIDDLDKLDETAERVGVSVESLSSLNYAGRMSGVQFDDMTGALTKLSVKMQDAAVGGKEAAALFGDIGVKVEDSSGKLKSADVVFAEVAERFSKLEDGAGKTALAVDLFGKSGAQLVPLLNQGAAGLERMRKEADALGAIIDDKLAKQAAEFNDNLDRLAIASSAVGRSIVADLIPPLNNLSTEFLDGISAAGGFWAALKSAGTLNPFKNTSENLAEVRSDLAKIEEDRKNYGYVDEERLKRKTNQLEYLKKLQVREALALGDGVYSNEGRGLLPSSGKEKIVRTLGADGAATKKLKRGSAAGKDAAGSFADYDEQILQRIAGAIEKTDVVKAAELVKQLETLDKLAAAGLDPVIVQAVRDDLTGAAKIAADEFARLNSMLAATDSSQLEVTRKDMQLLTDALTSGRIAEEKYLEAVAARLDGTAGKAKDAASEVDEFAKSAAQNIQSTLADFLFDPFAEGADKMVQKFGQVLQRMIADAAAAQIGKLLFGDMGSGKSGGGSGLVGAGMSALGKVDWASLFSFDGGGSTGGGARSGGLDGKGGFMALLHPQETVVDHTRGQRASGGGVTNVFTINVASGTPSEVKRAAGAGARSALSAIGSAQRYA